MLRFIIVTTNPDSYPSIIGCPLILRALKNDIWQLEIINLYEYGTGVHRKIDDKPYGGGPGMVIMCNVIELAIKDLLARFGNDIDFYCTSPRGELFHQKMAMLFSGPSLDLSLNLTSSSDYKKMKKTICMICPRFEGIDQRVIEYFNIKEISIGNFVVTNGDIAAGVIINATVRLLSGVLGNSESLENETFSSEDYYEHDQYTRPSQWNGLHVPDILLSGDHKKINKWKNGESDL